MQIGDCARTVHESNVFIALGLASSEKQIPQIVENIGNQNSGRSYWRGLRFFASRGSPVRSRSRPPYFSFVFIELAASAPLGQNPCDSRCAQFCAHLALPLHQAPRLRKDEHNERMDTLLWPSMSVVDDRLK